MKKIGVLLIIVLFLSGCSRESKEIERGMALRTKLLQANSCSFDADITADYGDKMYTFSMRCEMDDDGDVDFTVTAPETIRDITGSVSEKKGVLTYDDIVLQFDKMADEQITPVCSPWILIKTLRSGYLTSACTEEGLIRLSVDDSYEEDALHLDIWLDSKDLPSRAEILYDGKRIVSLNIKNVVIM